MTLTDMRLPDIEHTSRPWRIHELTRDFRLEDVWALPTPGGADDFPQLVQQFASGDPAQRLPGAARRRQRPHVLEPEVVGELVDPPGSGGVRGVGEPHSWTSIPYGTV